MQLLQENPSFIQSIASSVLSLVLDVVSQTEEASFLSHGPTPSVQRYQRRVSPILFRAKIDTLLKPDRVNKVDFYLVCGFDSLIRSVLRASKFSVLKLIEIVFLGVTPSLSASACFGTFWSSLFNFLYFFVWL